MEEDMESAGEGINEENSSVLASSFFIFLLLPLFFLQSQHYLKLHNQPLSSSLSSFSPSVFLSSSLTSNFYFFITPPSVSLRGGSQQ